VNQATMPGVAALELTDDVTAVWSGDTSVKWLRRYGPRRAGDLDRLAGMVARDLARLGYLEVLAEGGELAGGRA